MVLTSTLKRLLILPLAVGLFAITNPLAAQVDPAKGQTLFEQNCTSCHTIDGPKGTGPNLRDVHKRHKEEWMLKWVKNSTAMIAANDKEAVAVFEANNKVAMTPFEWMKDDEIKSILKYLETAPAATASVTPPTGTPSTGDTAAPPTNAGNGFYNNTTLLVLILLVVVMITIGALLSRVKGMMRIMLANKYPEDEELAKPSWYQAKFRPWLKNLNPTITTLVIVTVLGVIGFGAYFDYANTEIGVQQGYAPTQPINFPHDVHASQYKIDCQFCHSTASTSKQASVPSVNTCMNCHKTVDAADKYNGEVSPEIKKIRDAYNKNEPIRWVRIHNLPDLAYFNHSQHVGVGKVECQACHGPVEKMKKVEQFASLQMGWCVNCHREAKVDVENNDYYEKLHKDMEGMGRKSITVAMNGGLECGKCHY